MPVVGAIAVFQGASALAAGALTAFQTIAAIGSIVGGIGAITGNKDLLKIGAVAGLAGGIGALAQNKGWLASASAADTAAGAASGGNIQAMTQAAAPGMESALPNPVQDFGQAAGSNAAELGTAGVEQLGSAPTVDGSLAQNITGVNPLANSNPLTEPASGLFNEGPLKSDAFNAAKDSQLANNMLGPDAIQGYRTDTAAGSGSIFGNLKGFGEFVEKNKTLASIAGNFIGGAFDEEKQAKADYYKSTAELARQRAKNASAVPRLNFQVDRSGPLFKPPAPVYNAPQPPGLFYAR